MRRMLLWLAIGMLGAAAPAAATGMLRVSNCMTSVKELAVYNQVCPIPGSVYQLSVARP